MALTAKQGAEYLNSTLESLGYDYRIDTTSDATLTASYQAVGAFPPNMLDNILNMQLKILVQRAYSSMFTESKNPTRRFWRAAVDYGGGMQETFLKLIEAEDGYWAEDFGGTDDDALASKIAQDLVSFKKDEVINKIHTVNQKFRVKMSISDLEYAKVFTPNGYADFVGTKYANFQQSAEAHLMDLAIQVIKQMVDDQKCVFKTGFNLNSPNGVTSFVETLNATSDGMATLANVYNFDGVRTTTDADDIYLVTTPEVFNRMKSRGYANAFNLQEYINKNKIIMLPAGTDLGNDPNGNAIGAMLLDYRAVLMAVKYWEVQPFIVSNTDYRNTFLKVQLISGYTEFFNAVAFGTGELGNFTDGGYATIEVKGIYTTGITDMDEMSRFVIDGKPWYKYSVLDLTDEQLVKLQFQNMVIQVPIGALVEYDYTQAVNTLGDGVKLSIGMYAGAPAAIITDAGTQESNINGSVGSFRICEGMTSFGFNSTSIC